jgi:hypothetical protein
MTNLGCSTATTSVDECFVEYTRGGVYTATLTGSLLPPWAMFSVDAGGDTQWYVVAYAVSGSALGAVLGKTTLQSTADGSSRAWRQATGWDGAAPAITSGSKYSLQVFTPLDGRMNIARTLTGGIGAYADVGGTAIPDPFPTTHTDTTSLYRIHAEITTNVAPLAPTKVSPADGASLDPAQSQTFEYTFNDSGDVQTANCYRYRKTTVGTWTGGTVWTATPYARFVIPGGSLGDANDYYVQVATKDASGTAGAWSNSWIVTAAAVAGVPIITDPANGEAIATASQALTWTQTNQDGYRARIVADLSGAPDPTDILWDSDVVEEAATRTVTLDLTAYNGTAVHLEVASRYGVAWSDYADVRVDVAFTAPHTPTVTLTANSAEGRIEISATHPAPDAGEPAATSMDIYAGTTSTYADAIRIAAALAPDATFHWYGCASGVEYYVWVRANAADGTSATSAATT